MINYFTAMTTNTNLFNSQRLSLALFILSVFSLIYWLTAKTTNVYKTAALGAVFEMVWLPMLAMLAIIPITSLIILIKKKVLFRSLSFYALIIIAMTILLIILA
jgi:hypothetical protein